jgi:hypothetical protein
MTATTAYAPPHRATYTDWSPSDKMEPGDSLRLSIAFYPGYLPQISTAKSAKAATLKCSDCGKPDVHLTDFFLVPDKVWDALCPLDAIVCLGCFGKRLNPANPPQGLQHLGAEIRRQRRRFKLKNVNRWLGESAVYRGRYIVLFDWEPKSAEAVAGMDEEMLKKGMTSNRVDERNAACAILRLGKKQTTSTINPLFQRHELEGVAVNSPERCSNPVRSGQENRCG